MKNEFEVGTLEGNNLEIGREIGRFWGEFFKRNSNNNVGAYKWGENIRDYTKRFDGYYKKSYKNMLDSATKYFPETCMEIVGIGEGLKDCGFKKNTDFLNMFLYCLGESDFGCTSIVKKMKNGFHMGHSEENNAVYPLLLSKYKVKKGSGDKEFIAASYPLQLPGSACGGNNAFFFNGNSIEFRKDKLKKILSEHQLPPKTFITRNFLEMDSIEKAIGLLKKYGSSLPTHHFFISSKECRSFEYCPPIGGPSSIFRNKKISNECHTNHFIQKDMEEFNENILDNSKKSSEKRLGLIQKNGLQCFDKLVENYDISAVVNVKYCDSGIEGAYECYFGNKKLYKFKIGKQC